MDTFTGNVAQRTVDHALAFEAGLVGKGGRFDHHGKMRFAATIVSGMAGMLCAVVDTSSRVGLKASFRRSSISCWTDPATGSNLLFGGFLSALRSPS